MSNTVSQTLKIKKMSSSAIIPTRGSEHAAGYDLYSPQDFVVPPRGKFILPLQIAMIIPHGYFGKIHPRSSVDAKRNITTGAGVIDSDYRGEVKVLLRSHSDEDQFFTKGCLLYTSPSPRDRG